MCHLALEKGLKGLYQKKFQIIPEKSHNLIFFLEKIEILPQASKSIGKFIVRLNEASVATRYPESLELISKNYTRDKTHEILNQTRETLKWIKNQY